VLPLEMFSMITPTTAPQDWTCLGHIGWRDRDMLLLFFVVLPKVAKAST
jgi:hypothetical protein